MNAHASEVFDAQPITMLETRLIIKKMPLQTLSYTTLSEIENNKKQPSLELLEKYSEIYGIKLSSLILLSEHYDDANKSNKSDKFIRGMMIKFIEKMTPDLEE